MPQLPRPRMDFDDDFDDDDGTDDDDACARDNERLLRPRGRWVPAPIAVGGHRRRADVIDDDDVMDARLRVKQRNVNHRWMNHRCARGIANERFGFARDA